MNAKVWLNGRLLSERDATVPLTADAVLRGINVFEGIMAYWRASEARYAVVSLDSHLDRLARSASLMRLPGHEIRPRTRAAIGELLALQVVPQVYLRPTLYLERGYHESDPPIVGHFVSAREVEPSEDVRPIDCIVSSLRHLSAEAYPAEAKIGASYAFYRLSRIQASEAGAGEAILLSPDGHVAETPGAAIFARFGDTVATPPLNTGILPSITRATAIGLIRSEFGLEVVERAIGVEELYGASEVFLAGTLDEIRSVRSIDGNTIGRGEPGFTARLRGTYLRVCRDGGVDSPLGTGLFRGLR